MTNLESVSNNGEICCHIIRREFSPTETTFVTSQDSVQQVGFIVRGAGESIPRHLHKPASRTIMGTPEVLLVRTGRCEVDLYSSDQTLVATRVLSAGDIIILVGGGHGFRMLADTVLIEVKQGPYLGQDDKLRF